MVLAFLFHSACAKFAYIIFADILGMDGFLQFFYTLYILHLQLMPGQEARFQQPSSLGMDPEGKAVRDKPGKQRLHKDQEDMEESVEIRMKKHVEVEHY